MKIGVMGTVDGSEIRRSPVEVGSLSHYLQGLFFTSQVVVWDFFHQQYNPLKNPMVSMVGNHIT